MSLVLACSRSTPEARVREAFRACVRAVEDGDVAGATEVLSPRFEGPDQLDAAGARLYLLGVLRRQKVRVRVLDDRVRVEGGQARQVVDVVITGQGEGRLWPNDAIRRTFELRWEAWKNTWRLRELQVLEARE